VGAIGFSGVLSIFHPAGVGSWWVPSFFIDISPLRGEVIPIVLMADPKPPAGANSDGKSYEVRENWHPGVGAIDFGRCWLNKYSGMIGLQG
jgi:hypothetical protein